MNSGFKKIIILLVINFILFFSFGYLIYEKREDYRDKLNPFFDSLGNEKVGLYYLNLDFFQRNHKYLEIRVVNSTGGVADACYAILVNKLSRTTSCQNDIEIILDEHAMSSMIMSSYRMKDIILSEFLFGHIKIHGLKFQDFLGVLK